MHTSRFNADSATGKRLKQNLRIKSLVGISRNAVLTQMLQLMQLNLFERRACWRFCAELRRRLRSPP